jgi:glycerophosphoryl diester phosphodiesterase
MTSVMAHRGASAVCRENTLEAFVAARRLGADMVELDVRRTADDALVVHHDAVIPGIGPIVDQPRAALPDWVPTLATAIEACAGMVTNVEVKSSPFDPDFADDRRVATAVAQLVATRGWQPRVLTSSFDLLAVDEVRAGDPTIATALLTLPGLDQLDLAATARAHGHRVLHPHDTDVTRDLVRALHDEGMEVNVWTVDDPERMRVLVEWGVDGICTNVPDVLVGVLTALRA